MLRRSFLKLGLAGGALTLPGLLRLRAASSQVRKNTAVILLYCHGGISHIDTWDPKPQAPEEYRGPFKPIQTRSTGMLLTELLPRHAAIADKFSLLGRCATRPAATPAGPSGSFPVTTRSTKSFAPKIPTACRLRTT